MPAVDMEKIHKELYLSVKSGPRMVTVIRQPVRQKP
jgi:hypothetical protein